MGSNKFDLVESNILNYWIEKEQHKNAYIFPNIEEFNTARLFKRTGDKKILLRVLRSENHISYVMRDFIANELEGGKAGRKFNPDRDISIALTVHNQLKTTPHLRANKKEDGAATIIGKQYNLSEGSIIKIYNTKRNQFDLDESIKDGCLHFK